MKFTLLTLTVCSLILLQSFVSPFKMDFVKNLIIESKDIVLGTARNAKSFLPSPTEVFGDTKNLVAGLPFEYVASSINTACSTLVSTKTVESRLTPEAESMNFQLRTECSKYSIPLLQPEGLLKIKHFNVTKKTVIVVTGWTTTVSSSPTIDLLSKAYSCRGDYNFLALDAASFVDTLYSWASLNTVQIGEYLGQNLVKLANVVPLESIHLIGHSLGAHICGVAGRTFNKLTNKLIPRITALDPAKPCFNEGENFAGITRGDAQFIDVIHTNPGVLGKKEAIGDVDFYPDGMARLPTGCLELVCAHNRAWMYFLETVYPGNERNFMARRCSSLSSLKKNKCTSEEAIPMGIATPSHVKGTYMLEVKGSSPFGMDGDATREDQYVWCGTCMGAGVF